MNFEKLDRFMEHLVNDIGIPSADLEVRKAGKVLYRYSVGYQDREMGTRLRRDAVYNIYSCSKPITCTAALICMEEGKFLLTDPVAMYIPEFGQMSVRQPDGSTLPAKNQIRILDLFTMSAGLDYNLYTDAVKQVVADTNGRAPTVEVAKAIAKSPLSFEPGTHWQYSLCHDVLAAVVEVASGKRFSEYVKEKIFDPLGMNDTSYHLTPAQKERFATRYYYDFSKKQAFRDPNQNGYVLGPDYDSGGAGVITTLADYSAFARMMACGGVSDSGERVISKASIDLMRSDALDDVRKKDFNWVQMTGYTYGLGVRTVNNPVAGGVLSPVGEFGWGGAAGAYLAIDPKNQVSIVYMQNMLGNLEEYTHPRLRNIIYSILE